MLTPSIPSGGPRWWRRTWFDHGVLLLTFCIGLSSTVTLYRALVNSSHLQRQEQLNAMGQSVLAQLDTNLSRRMEAIRGLSLMVSSQLFLERTEFNRYANNMVDDGQNFGFAEWQPKVSFEQLPAFEAQARSQGVPGFRVTETKNGQRQPVSRRDEYYPVLFAWPERVDELGLDRGQETEIMQAKRKACDIGGVTASGSFDLTSATGQRERAFMISAPVFPDSIPISIEARRSALRGYVSALVMMKQVLQTAVFNADAAGLDMLVIDPSLEAGHLVYVARGEKSDLPQQLGQDYPGNPSDLVLTMEVGTRPWEIVLHPRPSFFDHQGDNNARITLASGIGATLLLVLTLAWTQRSRREIERTQRATLAAEHALAQERARLSHIIEGTHAGTWEWHVPTGEMNVNQRCLEMLGLARGEGEGGHILTSKEHWRALCHPDDIERVSHLLKQHFSGELSYYDCEHRMRHQDGHWVWVLSRGKVSSWLAAGQAEWMYGTLMDISERKSLDDLKGEFVSTVSHELRTPLTSIRGALGLAISDVLGEMPQKAKPVLTIAYKNALRLGHLVDDLLDMEKLLAGKMELTLELQALMPLIEQTLESVTAFAEEYQVSFVIAERKDGVKVAVEAVRLQQVLSNFLSNAAKFSPKGGQVQVRVVYVGDSVRVEVADQGPGIPVEFHKRIFQKFAQADSSDTRKKGGTGLGLAISKELMERMHGRVGFYSEPGQGATFYLELPIR